MKCVKLILIVKLSKSVAALSSSHSLLQKSRGLLFNLPEECVACFCLLLVEVLHIYKRSGKEDKDIFIDTFLVVLRVGDRARWKPFLTFPLHSTTASFFSLQFKFFTYFVEAHVSLTSLLAYNMHPHVSRSFYNTFYARIKL